MSNAVDEELPPSTAPMPLSMTIGGLVDAEKATEFANLVGGYIHLIGRALDVSRIDAVTITDRYAEALAQVERGFETQNVATHSQNEDIVGVAMCVHVIREDMPKVHLVVEIEMLLPLWVSEPGSPEHTRSLQLLAHECAHIEDLKRKDEASPGSILRERYADEFEQMFAPVGSSMWEEYYACRRTAHFDPSGGEPLVEALLTCLDNNQGAIDDAIRRYRHHADLHQLIDETHDRAMRALRVAAYLIGHYDGLAQDWQTISEVAERLKDHRLQPLLDDMADELRNLWDRRFDWTSSRETKGLNDIAWDAYVEAGVIARETSGGGLDLEVPFTAETL